MDKPTLPSVLAALPRERLLDLGRVFGLGIAEQRATRATLAERLARSLRADRLPHVLRELGRDELRAVCRGHGLPGEDRHRDALIERIATAAGLDAGASVPPPSAGETGIPRRGQILSARGRQWLVEDVRTRERPESPVLVLACLDDDAPGRRLEMLWDLELGARVLSPEIEAPNAPARLDPPAHFGAYLHALKWSAVSAADATRFQAPFRAGIKLMAHQLTPLMKALELPRANLFIADDVGLGKTIEAGLVLQELILRQQAGVVLIVCPASVTLQWRDEMMRRFGLRFEVMSRQFVARRRQERGFGVNPWATHNRFIVSYSLIRRPEYRDPLRAHLGDRAPKGLLILDEAHVVAPASASKYAVDTETTSAIRALAPKFDNRLFLSATPHNGHSNSFGALLELLDPARFLRTRTGAIDWAEALAPVMVRRLKRDLRQLDVARFPRRILCQVALTHGPGGWSATEERYDAESGARSAATTLAADLGGERLELELAELLERYTGLCSPSKGRPRLAFISLQKRLLSSPEAFARTLQAHMKRIDEEGGVKVRAPSPTATLFDDPETHGVDDDIKEEEARAEVSEVSKLLPTPTEEATALLKKMRSLAEKARGSLDGKTAALLAWLRQNCCPGREWTERRVIIFTEYGDTKRYLVDLLTQAIARTHNTEGRILTFHGGMGDEAREEVQQAFNAPPVKHPCRILIATDAAREGLNLQAHCADLFHFDIPWNPSRMEQRNGRIDRTLQEQDEVRCHHFVYSQRKEDRVLETLVRKVATVQREVGSVGAVLMDQMERILDTGIDAASIRKLEAVGDDSKARTAEAELEAQRKKLDVLEAEVHRASQRLERSRRALEVSPAALRGVVEVGLELAGALRLAPGPRTADGKDAFILPALDRSWDTTLDVLRPSRGRTEAFWEWRRRPPRAVTFEPLAGLVDDAEQLHLSHPLVRRILDRFVAQGFGAHDLSRVCGVVVPGENVARVIAYARLTLFGQGAARLHDEIVAVAAPWPEPGGTVSPYKDAATATKAWEVTEAALAAGAKALPPRPTERARREASALLAALWPYLDADANALEAEARTGLARRARKEADELRVLLERQRDSIADAGDFLRQTKLFELGDQDQKRQVELDIEHLGRRTERIAVEIEEEPKAIEALYDVQMARRTPIGLVFAWPENMT